MNKNYGRPQGSPLQNIFKFLGGHYAEVLQRVAN